MADQEEILNSFMVKFCDEALSTIKGKFKLEDEQTRSIQESLNNLHLSAMETYYKCELERIRQTKIQLDTDEQNILSKLGESND